jgi:hypothetical protein
MKISDRDCNHPVMLGDKLCQKNVFETMKKDFGYLFISLKHIDV